MVRGTRGAHRSPLKKIIHGRLAAYGGVADEPAPANAQAQWNDADAPGQASQLKSRARSSPQQRRAAPRPFLINALEPSWRSASVSIRRREID